MTDRPGPPPEDAPATPANGRPEQIGGNGMVTPPGAPPPAVPTVRHRPSDEPLDAPPVIPAASPGPPKDEPIDALPRRPVLRRLVIALYVCVVLCVIIALLATFIPWGDLDLPIDPPFRYREYI